QPISPAPRPLRRRTDLQWLKQFNAPGTLPGHFFATRMVSPHGNANGRVGATLLLCMPRIRHYLKKSLLYCDAIVIPLTVEPFTFLSVSVLGGDSVWTGADLAS